jgi:hypothetical protein
MSLMNHFLQHIFDDINQMITITSYVETVIYNNV